MTSIKYLILLNESVLNHYGLKYFPIKYSHTYLLSCGKSQQFWFADNKVDFCDK